MSRFTARGKTDTFFYCAIRACLLGCGVQAAVSKVASLVCPSSSLKVFLVCLAFFFSGFLKSPATKGSELGGAGPSTPMSEWSLSDAKEWLTR